MTSEQKQKIDNMDYRKLLTLWRFSEFGNVYFVGETGKYFQKVLNEKREALSQGEAVKISKEIGWKQ